MEEKLLAIIDKYEDLDAIVVEGYDGVGKGKVLQELSDYFGVVPYRPDYNLWQRFDHRNVDRWKISGFFWDVYSHFNQVDGCYKPPMLFDRGVISGAVYNQDFSIAKYYKEMLRDMKVLHILVSCEEEDYLKFLKSRNPDISNPQIRVEMNKLHNYGLRYFEALQIAGVEFEIYFNKYDEKIDSDKCSSCGHYSYGICRHPKINKEVCGENKRCELSQDEEVQDVSKVYSMQSE